MKKLAFIIILIAIISCKKDNQNNDPVDPIVKDTTITYPEEVNGALNLLKLTSGTDIKPDTIYSISAILGEDATLKVILNDPSSTATTNWNIVEGSNTGWTVSAYENGHQELIASDTGLINLQIKFSNSGTCNIQKFENQMEVSNEDTQIKWKTLKFILAGVINDSNYQFYDYLLRFDEDINLDINEDGQNDLYLYSYYEHWNGGAMTWSKPYTKSLGTFEILADTTIKTNTFREIIKVRDSIIYDSTLTEYNSYWIPKILEFNDTIDRQGTWIKNNDLIFSYYSGNIYWEFGNDTIRSYYYKFQGWNDIGYKYLGYRFISQGDTLYGWLNLNHSSETVFEIKGTSYK